MQLRLPSQISEKESMKVLWTDDDINLFFLNSIHSTKEHRPCWIFSWLLQIETYLVFREISWLIKHRFEEGVGISASRLSRLHCSIDESRKWLKKFTYKKISGEGDRSVQKKIRWNSTRTGLCNQRFMNYRLKLYCFGTIVCTLHLMTQERGAPRKYQPTKCTVFW
jgi:hypothetical protein